MRGNMEPDFSSASQEQMSDRATDMQMSTSCLKTKSQECSERIPCSHALPVYSGHSGKEVLPLTCVTERGCWWEVLVVVTNNVQ